MRIEITATNDLLTQENARLDQQISDATEQENTITNVSFANRNLRGESYEAAESRIKMNALVLQMHRLAYEELQTANHKNSLLLSSLPYSLSNGVLDTDECTGEIAKCNARINGYMVALDSLTSSALEQSFSIFTTIDYHTLYDKVSSVYNELIAVEQDTIRVWEEKIQKAEEYKNASRSLYDDAKSFMSTILAEASSAVEEYVVNGAYSANAYNLLSGSLRLREIKPYLDDEQYAAMEAALSNDGIITQIELYSGFGSFNDTLYSALVALSLVGEGMVTENEVAVIAETYNAMWVNGDCKSIEDFFECSYVPVPGETRNYEGGFYGAPLLITPIGARRNITYQLYEQSPLLGRVADYAAKPVP